MVKGYVNGKPATSLRGRKKLNLTPEEMKARVKKQGKLRARRFRVKKALKEAEEGAAPKYGSIKALEDELMRCGSGGHIKKYSTETERREAVRRQARGYARMKLWETDFPPTEEDAERLKEINREGKRLYKWHTSKPPKTALKDQAGSESHDKTGKRLTGYLGWAGRWITAGFKDGDKGAGELKRLTGEAQGILRKYRRK